MQRLNSDQLRGPLVWILSFGNAIGQAAAVGFDLNRLFFYSSFLGITGLAGVLVLLGVPWAAPLLTVGLILVLLEPAFVQGFMYYEAIYEWIWQRDYQISNKGLTKNAIFKAMLRLRGYLAAIGNAFVKGLAAFAGIYAGFYLLATLSTIAPLITLILTAVMIVGLYLMLVKHWDWQTVSMAIATSLLSIGFGVALFFVPQAAFVFALSMAAMIGISTAINVYALPGRKFLRAWKKWALGEDSDQHQEVTAKQTTHYPLVASFAVITNALGQFASVWLPNLVLFMAIIAGGAALFGLSLSASTVMVSAAIVSAVLAGGTLVASGLMYGKETLELFGFAGLNRERNKLYAENKEGYNQLNKKGVSITGYIKYDSALGKGLAAFMGMLKGAQSGIGLPLILAIPFAGYFALCNAIAVYAKPGREAERDFRQIVDENKQQWYGHWFGRSSYKKIEYDLPRGEEASEPDSDVEKGSLVDRLSMSPTLRHRPPPSGNPPRLH